MLDFIYHCKAGQDSFYIARKRGTVDVWHDSQRFVYRVSRKDIKSFKRDIYYAFSQNGSVAYFKIKGQFPSYTVETFLHK